MGPGFLLHRLRKPVGEGFPEPQPFGAAVEILARLQDALHGEVFTVAPRGVRLQCERDGRRIAYGLGGDPVEVIALGDKVDDALPLVEALRDLGPFGVYDAAHDRWMSLDSLAAPTTRMATPPAKKKKNKKRSKR